MEKLSWKAFFSGCFDEATTEDWDKLFLQLPKVQKIIEKVEQFSDAGELKAFIDAEIKNLNPVDVLRDMDYIGIPEVKVYLIPGFTDMELCAQCLFEIVLQHIRLDSYIGNIFAFRSRDRKELQELRMGRWSPAIISTSNKYSQFIDPEWTDDEPSVKVLPIEDFKVLLDRMMVPKESY